MTILARITSYIFHPLLMLTYLMALLALFMPTALYPINLEIINGFLLIVFLMTFAIPVLGISFFKIFGTIQSFKMEDRRERILPFVFTSLFYLIVTYLFHARSGIPLTDSVLKILIIVDSLVIFGTLVTIFYKISMHAMASCGLVGILLPLNNLALNNMLLIPTIVAIVLAGVVCSSRLKLNAHTPGEVLTGSVLGIGIGLLGMIYWY